MSLAVAFHQFPASDSSEFCHVFFGNVKQTRQSSVPRPDPSSAKRAFSTLAAPSANERVLATLDNWHWATSAPDWFQLISSLCAYTWSLAASYWTSNTCGKLLRSWQPQIVTDAKFYPFCFFHIRDFRRKCVMVSGSPPPSLDFFLWKKPSSLTINHLAALVGIAVDHPEICNVLLNGVPVERKDETVQRGPYSVRLNLTLLIW